MPTIGSDCHITLTHADINNGNAYGFLLTTDRPDLGPHVSVQRSVTSDGVVTIRCYFTVLLADNAINPDGSQHVSSRAAMYTMLIQYLASLEGVMLNTVNGLYANLGTLGHSATEMHFSSQSVISCMFNNADTYWPPVPPITFNNSVWDGTLTWETSYWR